MNGEKIFERVGDSGRAPQPRSTPSIELARQIAGPAATAGHVSEIADTCSPEYTGDKTPPDSKSSENQSEPSPNPAVSATGEVAFGD